MYSSYTKPEEIALRRVLRTLDRTGYGAALLMLETGLRVGECLALKWGDILWSRKALQVNQTVIRLNNKRLMEVQDGAKSFTSNRTIPLSKAANVPYKGQHSFQHTFATNCYNRGADVKILPKILGHSNISVTYNVYIHLYGDALEEMRSVVG